MGGEVHLDVLGEYQPSGAAHEQQAAKSAGPSHPEQALHFCVLELFGFKSTRGQKEVALSRRRSLGDL